MPQQLLSSNSAMADMETGARAAYSSTMDHSRPPVAVMILSVVTRPDACDHEDARCPAWLYLPCTMATPQVGPGPHDPPFPEC